MGEYAQAVPVGAGAVAVCAANPLACVAVVGTTACVVTNCIKRCYDWATSANTADKSANENGDEGGKESSGPKTGNPVLDDILEGSTSGDGDKGWNTPGTQKELEERVKNIPGAVQKPTGDGGTTMTLPDGTKIDIYPGRKSKDYSEPGWSVTKPGRRPGSGGKGSIGGVTL